MADTGHDERGMTTSDNLGLFFFPSINKFICILSAFGKSKETNRQNSYSGKVGPEACRKAAASGKELQKKPRGPQGWERSFSISWRLEKERTMVLISRQVISVKAHKTVKVGVGP